MSPSDTTPRIAQLQSDIVSKLSGAERLLLAIDMSETMRGLTFARLKREHPGIPHGDLIRAYFRCIVPAEQIPSFFG